MIAKPDRHIENEELRRLLDDALSSEQVEQIESHLDRCETCRGELEELAGAQQWWQETVEVLSQSTMSQPKANLDDELTSGQAGTPTHASGQQQGDRLVDSSLDWIRPLLDGPTEDNLGHIDHYPIDSVIGQGGMGVVLRGTDPELNRPVAIKVLAPHLAGVGAARARFMREAQAAAAIVHPSIVPIYSIATAGRLPYIVMPCISGGNLQEHLEKSGPLALDEVLRIGLQVAEGLSAAHRQGVIHRDIKPANILMEEGNGRVLISDFGLARALDDATLTMSGMIAGTPQYMSPEQARGEAVDVRSDLFSLGSLIYALAIGRAPYRADSPLAVLRKITESRPRPIYEVNERMPAWLDTLTSRLMSIDKNHRIASADEAAVMLRESLAHVQSPSNNPLPKALRPSRTGQKQAVVLACISIAIASLIGAYQWGLTSNRAESNHSSNASTSGNTGHQVAGLVDPNADHPTPQPPTTQPPVQTSRLQPNEHAAVDAPSPSTGVAQPTAILPILPPASPDWLAGDIDGELAQINQSLYALELTFETLRPVEAPLAQDTPEPLAPTSTESENPIAPFSSENDNAPTK